MHGPDRGCVLKSRPRTAMLTATRRGTGRRHDAEADMKTLNPEYVSAVVRRGQPLTLLQASFHGDPCLWRGESPCWRSGLQEKHLQPFGMVHGGVYSSLVDAAVFLGGLHPDRPGPGNDHRGVETQFPGALPQQDASLPGAGVSDWVKPWASGRPLSRMRRGNLLAHGTSTTMIVSNLNIQGESGLPPKFLD